MTPHYADDSVTLYAGDCLDVLRGLPDASVDSVVTDPPYGLEFMGKEWDRFKVDRRQPRDLVPNESPHRRSSTGSGVSYGVGGSYGGDGLGAMRAFQQWCEAWSTECLRVLKPGGHLLAFGGTRTYHRLACAVEDAGFEIRDSISWLYGSGFPKSLDVSKAIDKAAGATREVIGERKQRANSPDSAVAMNASVGAVELITAPATDDARTWQGWGTALKPAHEPIVVGRKPLDGTVAANVLRHGTGAVNVDGCRVEGAKTPAPTRRGDSASWFTTNDAENLGGDDTKGRWPTNVLLDEHTAAELDRQSGYSVTPATVTRGGQRQEAYGMARQDDMPCYGDAGGASRFFPTFRYEPKAPTVERPRGDGVAHPTVKPLDLMRWLVRLVTPPGGTVLEPFAGSGTTAEACVIEGFRCIAIEREVAYLPLIVARLSKPIQPDMFGGIA